MAQSRKAENAKKRRRWEKHLEDWAASGVTQVAYCHVHNLSRQQFQYWKKRLHPDKVDPKNEGLSLEGLCASWPGRLKVPSC